VKRWLASAGAVLAALLLYFIAWPVPVDPVAWQAPDDRGLTGAFSSNELLATARSIDLGTADGPENLARGADGHLYAGVHDGRILRLPVRGGRPAVFAEVGGRPLGIEAAADGSLIVANAVLGVQRIARDGSVEVLLDSVDGEALVAANDVAIGSDGMLYVSESSRKFGTARYRGTLEASLLDILEHGGHGRVLAFDPSNGDVSLVLDGLNYANGVAVSDDGTALLIVETGSYRVLRCPLPVVGRCRPDVVIDNLPGFPDNIDNGLNGRFWIGLVNPRNAIVDRTSDRPFVRKVLQRLPAFLRPKPVRSSHVIAIDIKGEVLMDLQDPDARYPMLTGALELPQRIYFGALTGARLPYVDKSDLL